MSRSVKRCVNLFLIHSNEIECVFLMAFHFYVRFVSNIAFTATGKKMSINRLLEQSLTFKKHQIETILSSRIPYDSMTFTRKPN